MRDRYKYMLCVVVALALAYMVHGPPHTPLLDLWTDHVKARRGG